MPADTGQLDPVIFFAGNHTCDAFQLSLPPMLSEIQQRDSSKFLGLRVVASDGSLETTERLGMFKSKYVFLTGLPRTSTSDSLA